MIDALRITKNQRLLHIFDTIRHYVPFYESSDEKIKAKLEHQFGPEVLFWASTFLELYSGKISQKALFELRSNPKSSVLLTHFSISRRDAARILFTDYKNELNEDLIDLIQLFYENYLKYNLVLKSENLLLTKLKKTEKKLSESEIYAKAGVELIDLSLEQYTQINSIRPRITFIR